MEQEKPTLSLGDLIDKLSILSRKVRFGMEDAISEHRYLEKGLYSYGIDGKLVANIIRLAQSNFEIWELEHEIRHGGEGKFTLEEIGNRAIRIRDINAKRVEYKNKINALESRDGKEVFREVKVNHRSK